MDISAGGAAIRGLHSLEHHAAAQSGGGLHPREDLRCSASDAQTAAKLVTRRAERAAESLCHKSHCIQ